MPQRIPILLVLAAAFLCIPVAAAAVGSPAHRSTAHVAGARVLAATTAPTVTITVQPASPAVSSSSTVSWASQGAASTTCALGSTPPAFACASPLTLRGLAPGAHTVAVRVVNAAGSAHALAAWTISPLAAPIGPPPPPTPAPRATILSTLSSSANTTSATFTFSTANASAVACSLDGAAATPCSSPITYVSLPVGSHTFVVTASAGVLSGSDSFAWTVTPGPTVQIQSAPAAATAVTSATFAFTPANATKVACSLDGAAPTACSGSVTYNGLAAGQHTFVVT